VKSRGGESGSAASDESLLHRLQQDNQRRILGKLLHDLRNPVHSLRITIELFARLARRSGDIDALMDRAARYVAPAEAALESLLAVTGRFGLYLSPPAPPQIGALDVRECLPEVAILLGGAGRPNRVEVVLQNPEGAPPLQVEADRPRLSHVLLLLCNPNEGSVKVNATEEADSVLIEVLTESPAVAPGFTREELSRLIANAGGELTLAPNHASLRFKRSAPGPG
jgi:signal transduction histidine kinase